MDRDPAPRSDIQHAPRNAPNDEPRSRLTAFVRGSVQGVGFRWWVRSRALELGLNGHAANLSDGRVEVVAQGERGRCERLLRLLSEQPSTTRRPGRVVGVTEQWSPPRAADDTFVER